jgi:hypothetical protein
MPQQGQRPQPNPLVDGPSIEPFIFRNYLALFPNIAEHERRELAHFARYSSNSRELWVAHSILDLKRDIERLNKEAQWIMPKSLEHELSESVRMVVFDPKVVSYTFSSQKFLEGFLRTTRALTAERAAQPAIQEKIKDYISYRFAQDKSTLKKRLGAL